MDQLFYGFDTTVYTFFWQFQNSVTIAIADICQHLGDTTAYIIYFVISLLLCFPKKTRKCGVAMVTAFFVAFLLVNVLIKPGVASPDHPGHRGNHKDHPLCSLSE